MKTLTVDLGERSYPIYIGEALLGQTELLRQHIPGNSALVVTNETVAPLYLDRTMAMLGGLTMPGVLLAGKDPVATDAVATASMAAAMPPR